MARANNFIQPSLQSPDTSSGRPYAPSAVPTRMTVLYHLTLLDLYLLSPTDGADVNTGFVLGSMNGVSSPFGQGVHGGPYLAPGTHVLVLAATATGYADIGGKQTAIYPILSVDNEIPASDTWFWPVWKMTPDQWKLDTAGVEKAIEAYHDIPETDRLRGKPDDRLPGDWEVGTPLKGHLYAGGSRVGIEASPVASLHMYSDDSTVVFNKGLNYVEDLPWGRSGDSLAGDGSSLEADHKADTVPGAFGQKSAGKLFSPAQDIKSVAENVKVTVNESAPRWDWLDYRGRSVGGAVSQRVLGRRDDGSPQPGLFGFDGLDGTSVKGAASSLTLTRTPDLPYLEMLREIGLPDNPAEDAGKTVSKDFPEALADYASQYADLMYELMKRRFIERYWKSRKADKENWKALSGKEVAEQLGRSVEEAVIRPLGDDAPAYKSQDIHVDDPLTGTRKSLSRLESYIHLSPTGAVVISDGTGSEIRMEGGHIILSPAADIRVQPGRDAVFTIPRFLSMFSRDRLEITSDRGEMDIHAGKGLVLSAEGMAVLESRGTRRVTDASYDKRGNGGGVVIRSGTDTHILGGNIRLALQKGTDNSSDGVASVDDGMLAIDAGGSPVAVVGGNISIHSEGSVSVSSGSGEGLLADGGTLYLFSKKLVLPINQSIFGGSGTMKWIDLKESGMKSVYFPQPDSADVAVQGNLDVTKTVSAQTVAADKGRFKELKSFAATKKEKSLRVSPINKPRYRKQIDSRKQWEEKMEDPVVNLGDSGVSGWFAGNGNNPLLTADGVRRLGIYYPMASGYRQTGGFWTVSRWQRMLSGSRRSWIPTPVKDADGNDMLPFPGFDGWTEKPFMKSWDDNCSPVSTTLSGNWPVNAG